jgi:hypothetical protein
MSTEETGPDFQRPTPHLTGAVTTPLIAFFRGVNIPIIGTGSVRGQTGDLSSVVSLQEFTRPVTLGSDD